MRVRISFGLEIEDIPEQAQDLGRSALEELRGAMESFSKALDNIEECHEDYSLVLQMLEKVRLKLSKSDLIITDLHAILQGLNNYHIGEQNVSEGRSTMDSSGDPITQTEDNGEE